MHVIDDSSPLKAENAESLRASAAMMVLSISGADETTGQVLMARAVYFSSAIRWNEAFRDITERMEDGALHFDYGKFDEVVPLAVWQSENPQGN